MRHPEPVHVLESRRQLHGDPRLLRVRDRVRVRVMVMVRLGLGLG